MLASILEHRRTVGPARRSRNPTPASNFLLTPSLLLLERGCSRFDQSTLNAARNLRGEHRSHIQRPWNRLFPGPEHLIQLAASLRVDQGIGVHECLVHVAAQKQSVGSPYIFDNRVDYI